MALSLRLTDGEFHQVRLPMGIKEFFEQHVRPRLWDEVAKSIVSIILFGAGYISEVPIFWIVLCCFGVWAIWPWALLGHERLKKAYEKDANHEEWAGHEGYSIWQAACLWSDMEPHSRILPGSTAYPSLNRLKSAAEAGTLPTLTDDKSMKGRVSREALVAYAQSVGAEPAFLAEEPPEAP